MTVRRSWRASTRPWSAPSPATDGSKQLAVKGLPLYLFASDSAAGEAKGQAVGGVWWVVGADGQKITAKPAGSGNGDGY